MVVALAIAGVLLGNAIGDDLFGADEPELPQVDGSGGEGGDALVIAAAGSFDPEGDGDERGAEAGAVLDGDEATTWRTEGYDTVDFGGLGKSGVGLTLSLAEAAELEELVISSPSSGWAAEVYVADAVAGDLTGWGEPVDAAEGLSGTVAFDLDGRRGGAVLLWITGLAGPDDDGRFRVQVADVGIR